MTPHNVSAHLRTLTLNLIFILSLSGCTVPKIVLVNDPLTIEEHLRLGAIYESKGEIENAVKEYKMVLKKDKNNTEALFFLGNTYLTKGDLEKAETYYEKVISIVPTWGAVYNNLAWVYIKKNNDLTRAQALIDKALLLDPSNSAAYYDSLGLVFTRKGEYKRAEEVFHKALEVASLDEREEILSHLSDTHEKMRINEMNEESLK